MLWTGSENVYGQTTTASNPSINQDLIDGILVHVDPVDVRGSGLTDRRGPYDPEKDDVEAEDRS